MKQYKIVYQSKDEILNKIVDEIELENYKKEFDILSINPVSKIIDFSFTIKIKISKKELILLFYELNLMLESNINISDAISILQKSKKSKKISKFLNSLNYALANSIPINLALKEFILDDFIKDFLNISQNSANLNSNIKAIYLLLKEQEEIKKDFFKALYYPIFLLFTFILSIYIIFSFVVPSFKNIFNNQLDNLPTATKTLLKLENMFLEYSLFITVFIVFIAFLLIFLDKTSKKISYIFSLILFKYFFIFSNISRNLQLYRLFLVVDIMQKSKYEFHPSFVNAKLLVKNKYLLGRIELIDNLLENGKSISIAFKKSGIFDEIILNLLNTGEVSNNLQIVVSEIKNIYKSRFDISINRMITLISPIFLVFMASMILFLVLAIFTPIWQMGSLIK